MVLRALAQRCSASVLRVLSLRAQHRLLSPSAWRLRLALAARASLCALLDAGGLGVHPHPSCPRPWRAQSTKQSLTARRARRVWHATCSVVAYAARTLQQCRDIIALQAQRHLRGILRSHRSWARSDVTFGQTHKVTDFRQISDGQGLALVLTAERACNAMPSLQPSGMLVLSRADIFVRTYAVKPREGRLWEHPVC
jgi:hypothetical protein